MSSAIVAIARVRWVSLRKKSSNASWPNSPTSAAGIVATQINTPSRAC